MKVSAVLLFFSFSLLVQPLVAADRPLQEYAKSGDLNGVKKELAKGVNINAKNPDEGKMTALHRACEYGHLDVVQYLIQQGADPNVYNWAKGNVLSSAAYGGHKDIVIYLIQNTDVNVSNKERDGKTAAEVAASRKHSEIANYIRQVQQGKIKRNNQKQPASLEEGRPLDKPVQGNVQSNLMKAINNDLDIVIPGLIKKSADINETDREGNTALHYAIAKGKNRVVNLLVDAGADVNASNRQGVAPLHMAAKANHLKLCQYLIKKGAKANAMDSKGKTPVDYATDKAVQIYLISL